MGIASVVVNIFVLEITHHCSKYNTWMVAEWMRKLPTFVTHLSPNSGPWVYVCICSQGSTREETLKFQGGITSECPHKYLMCSISPCESSSVCVCVCVCAWTVITSLVQKHQQRKRGKGSEQEDEREGRVGKRNKSDCSGKHDYDNLHC